MIIDSLGVNYWDLGGFDSCNYRRADGMILKRVVLVWFYIEAI
jgi:hypothetical protein